MQSVVFKIPREVAILCLMMSVVHVCDSCNVIMCFCCIYDLRSISHELV
jgi:hypothetical protein